MPKLIINADDFGYSARFNQGIIEMIESGIVTSTTALVHHIDMGKQAEQIDRLSELRNGGVSVGLHFEADVSRQLLPQLVEQHEKFHDIFGFEPSHFDIHKLTTNRKIIEVENAYAEKLRMPVRNHGIRAQTKQPDAEVFASTSKPAQAIIEYLEGLKDDRTYEMMTHPGIYDPESSSSLNHEREVDMRNLNVVNDYLKTRKDIQRISYFGL